MPTPTPTAAPATPSPTATPVSRATPTPTPTPGATPIADVFDDEFDSLTFFNSVTGKGNWSPFGLDGSTKQGFNGWGAEYDVNPLTNTLGLNPYSVNNGVLTIMTDVAPTSIQSQIANYKYTSGAMRSVNVTMGNGYYEMRAQLPSGNGMWPAFWLLPADGGWPPEIDILEMLGNAPTVDNTTVHTQYDVSDAAYKFSNTHYAVGKATTVADTTAGFHTYGVDFRADNITFYFDRVSIFVVKTPPDLVNRPVFIVVDNAIGGWNGNAVDSTTKFPTTYKIDYIRVYSARPF